MNRDLEMTHNVALLGVTGALGRAIQSALEVDHEGIEQLFAVAGARSAGESVRWRGASVSVTAPAELAPGDVDFAIFATPPEVVSREAPRLLDAGARVIDASGVLASPPLPRALTAPAPMVWPHLTSFAQYDLERETAVALPSGAASTLAPVLDALTLPGSGLPPLAGVHATVLLAASHAGRPGIDALSRQSVGLLSFQPALDPDPFPEVLAFNAVAPTAETSVLFEAKTEAELRALVPALGAVAIELLPIWIAAFNGLVVSVHLRFAGDVDRVLVTRLLAAHPDLREREPMTSGDEAIDEDAEELEGDAEEAAPDEPEALSLRDAAELGYVRVGPPLFGERTVRLVLMSDPLYRTAETVVALLQRWMLVLEAS